ncbi:hypothetical protein B9T34_07575 [Acinetobacter sp. ANC 3813]|nr:hypothetical protein B9T34_07575 [Acinetobacter sp. ANC 3813]
MEYKIGKYINRICFIFIDIHGLGVRHFFHAVFFSNTQGRMQEGELSSKGHDFAAIMFHHEYLKELCHIHD